ncbi:MAG: SusC/RagA family TonB-linked outer membrane protein, partial [Paludibacteraceae bacterium]
SRAIPTYNVMTDPGMYYEKFWESMYNSQISKGSAYAAAYANQYLLDAKNGGLGYQVYTVPEGQNLIGTNGKLNPNATLGYNDGSNYFLPDNWYKELFKSNNLRQEYNVNVSGSTEKLTYFASASYLDDSGLMENSDYKRFTSRVSVDYQAKKWLKFGTNMSYAHADQRYPQDQDAATSATSSGNLFYVSNNIAPIYPLYLRDAQGNIMVANNGSTMYDYGDATVANAERAFMNQANPASAIDLNKELYKNDMFSGKYFVEVEFYKGLKATANIGLNYFGSRYQMTLNPYYGQFAAMGGQAMVEADRLFTLNQQYLLTYNNTFAGEHHLDLLVGYENYQYTSSYVYGVQTKLFNPDIAEVSNAILQPSTGSATDKYATQGILAQAKYDYAGRYFISASYRHDASSRFAAGKRWGDFWSVGAAWDIQAEPFMSAASKVDLLKLKISYGAQGNDNLLSPDGSTNWYPYADQYTLSENNGNFATAMSYKGNEDLTWETSYNLNGGLDFAFFGERFGGTIEGFWRKTVDMLYYKPVSPSLGYSYIPMNIGSVSNAGLDVELHGDVVKTRNVTWSLYANLSYFKNKILQLAPELNGKWIDGSYIYQEGGSLYQLYIREYAGVDKTTGAALWYKDVLDEEGNVTGRTTTTQWTSATQYDQGDILPKVYGGFGTTLEVFGVDLSVACNYQLGGRIIDASYQRLMHSGYASAGQNWHTDILNSWTPENTDTDIPRVNTSDQYTNSLSDRWLVSSNYLCLQNITLGYTLPKKWTERMKMQKLRVYFVADNVALASARQGLDPRQGFSSSNSSTYSPIRSLSGGISITF